jgi:hypothetical protein
MIDSRNKRASILGFSLAALVILPAPSGAAIDAAERGQLAYSYAGTVGTPTPPQPPQPPVIFVVNRFPQVPNRHRVTGDCAVEANRPVFYAEGTIRPFITLSLRSASAGGALDAVAAVDRPRIDAVAVVERTLSADLHGTGGTYRPAIRRMLPPRCVRGQFLTVASSERSLVALADIGRPTLTGTANVTAESAAVTGHEDDV